MTVWNYQGNKTQELDVSHGLVSFPYVYYKDPNMRVAASFNHNQSVSGVRFRLDSGGHTVSAPAVYNAQTGRFEAVLLDAFLGARSGAATGLITVDYAADIPAPDPFASANLTEEQYRNQLPSEWDYYNLSGVSEER
jgi:hypothetical protein